MAWLKQVAGALLVAAFILGVAAFVGILRTDGFGPGTAAIPGLLSVTPADGAVAVPVAGVITLEFQARPVSNPVVKLEPVASASIGPGSWNGATYSLPYSGLAPQRTYHAELDVDLSQKGEHRQATLRWSFTTGSAHASPTASVQGGEPSPSPSATSAFDGSPSPNPSVRYGPPLTPGPYIWYATGYGEVAVDWSGHDRVGLLWLDRATQSPDGSRLWYGGGEGINDPRVFDASGTLIGRVDDEPSAMWSDDSRHICEIVPGNPAELVTVIPGSTATPVEALVGQSGAPVLESCSMLAGTAVVAFQSTLGITAAEVISLRSPTLVTQLRYPNPVRRLVVSRDGQFAAEVIPPGTTSQVSTIFQRLSDGKMLTNLVGFDAGGFSWDGSLVAGLLTNATGRMVEIIQWPQQAPIVWQIPYPGDIPGTVEVPVSVLPRPGSSDLAVAFSYTTSVQGNADLYIVHGNGTSTHVTRQPFQPDF